MRSGWGDAQSKRIGSVATMASVLARIVVASSGPRWLLRSAALVSPHPTISNVIGRLLPLGGYHCAD